MHQLKIDRLEQLLLYPSMALVMVVDLMFLVVVDDVHPLFDLDLDEYIDLSQLFVDQLVVLKI